MRAAQARSADAGWSAFLHLGFRHSAHKTVLASRERFGPLAVQRPFYPEGDVCHVYLLHPPGGVVGGDLLQIEAEAAPGSHALITTPGATKFYRSAGKTAEQVQHLKVSDQACLEWMPQENIFFPGAQVRLKTRIDLQGSARIALWETQCLGRPVIDEAFDEGHLDARLEIYRDQQPLLIERLLVDSKRRLRSALLNGQPVSATAVFSHAQAQHLELARTLLADDEQCCVAATCVDDLLLIRYLGGSTEQARKLFTRVWTNLREPLLGRQPSTPRIWNT